MGKNRYLTRAKRLLPAGAAAERQAEGEPHTVITLTADCGIACQTNQVPEFHSDLRHNYSRSAFGVVYGADNIIEAHADSKSGERIDGFALPEVIMPDKTY